MKAVLFSKLIWGMLAGVAVGFWLGWMGRSSHDWLPDFGRAGAIGGTLGLLVGIVLDYAKLPSLGFLRRFRFGLRTLFVVVVIVSIPCAWVGYHLNWIRQRRVFIERQERSVFSSSEEYAFRQPPWSLFILGERPCGRLWIGPDDAEEARRLFPEASSVRATRQE